MSASISAALGQMADGLARLISEHFSLARLELERDARATGVAVARLGVFAQVALLGYAMICTAIAVGVGRWIGLPAGLGVVGGVNLLAAAFGLVDAGRRLKAQSPLRESLGEASRSAALLEVTGGS